MFRCVIEVVLCREKGLNRSGDCSYGEKGLKDPEIVRMGRKG